jgi:hypothetical protein
MGATPSLLTKDAWPGGVVPNVVDYAAARAGFSWAAARAELAGLPGGRGLNIAHFLHLERDYPALASVDGFVDYIANHSTPATGDG